MSANQIDQFILAEIGEHWRKVAMVVSRVSFAQGVPIPEGEAGLNMIAERIGALVADGRLVSQGDLKRWRHSEVRKP
jgi:hypothetical protein